MYVFNITGWGKASFLFSSTRRGRGKNLGTGRKAT